MDLAKYQIEAGKKLIDSSCASQIRLLELQEKEAAWKTLAAEHTCEKAENEKLVSAKTNERLAKQAGSILRPTTTMRPELRKDGDEWTVTYGELTARGPTPDTACQQFDAIWMGTEEW